jgi:hypothetical protein
MDAGTLELVELEQHLVEDCRCESAHLTGGSCTGDVVARVTSPYHHGALICSAAEAQARERIAGRLVWCSHCADIGADRIIADCWAVTPV